MENFQQSPNAVTNANDTAFPETTTNTTNFNSFPQAIFNNAQTDNNSSVPNQNYMQYANLSNLQNLGFIFQNSNVPLQHQFPANFLNGYNFVPLSNPNLYAQAAQFNAGLQVNHVALQGETDATTVSNNSLTPSNATNQINQTSNSSLISNVEYDIKNRPMIFHCKECPRKFASNSRLNTHMRCHNGERPYVCDVCNFGFTQKSYLIRHAAVHKDERPYVCDKCSKTYKHYGSLANHRKTHNKDSIRNNSPDTTTSVKQNNDENINYPLNNDNCIIPISFSKDVNLDIIDEKSKNLYTPIALSSDSSIVPNYSTDAYNFMNTNGNM